MQGVDKIFFNVTFFYCRVSELCHFVRSLLDEVVDGRLVFEEVGPDQAVVDGRGALHRGHAPKQEHALKIKRYFKYLHVHCKFYSKLR